VSHPYGIRIIDTLTGGVHTCDPGRPLDVIEAAYGFVDDFGRGPARVFEASGGMTAPLHEAHDHAGREPPSVVDIRLEPNGRHVWSFNVVARPDPQLAGISRIRRPAESLAPLVAAASVRPGITTR
jgi:hypothetical protein